MLSMTDKDKASSTEGSLSHLSPVYILNLTIQKLVCNTMYMVQSADIKFGNLGANTGWWTFSMVNQLNSYI